MAKQMSKLFLIVTAIMILGACSSSALPTVEGAIGDWVWLDANGNGIQDDEELGVENVEVLLFRVGEEQSEKSTLTDLLGQFSFQAPENGEYYLKFNPPQGFAFTLANVDDDDNVDSDARQTDGVTQNFNFADGEIIHSLDAGLIVFLATPTFTPIPSNTPTATSIATATAVPSPTAFMPEHDTHELDAEFTLVQGDCDIEPSFTETIVATIDGNMLTLRNTFMGISSTGTINPDGSFEAMNPDYESYAGRFEADWSGEAVYIYFGPDGCQSEFRVVFTPRN